LTKFLGRAKILAMPTATYQLIEARLGKDLRRYVAARRRGGRSWPAIALSLHDATGMVVSSESLRLWFRDLPGPAATISRSAVAR